MYALLKNLHEHVQKDETRGLLEALHFTVKAAILLR
jgi:hypothetical protein